MALSYNHFEISDTQINTSVRAILDRVLLCSLATVGPNGESHISTAFFACSELLDLYFLSDPATLHCKNIADRPSVGVTVFDTHQQWGELLQGLQLLGEAFVAEGDSLTNAQRLYRGRFAAYAEWNDGLSAVVRDSLKSRF